MSELSKRDLVELGYMSRVQWLYGPTVRKFGPVWEDYHLVESGFAVFDSSLGYAITAKGRAVLASPHQGEPG